MKTKRIYIDTSVIGGCYDIEFKEYSNKLFEYFNNAYYIPVISNVVIAELVDAPGKVKKKLEGIQEKIDTVVITEEMIALSKKYLDEKIVTKKYSDDALHIAVATVSKVDVLVSWNFKHIVNLDKIHKFNAVNLIEGYSLLEIRTPREVIDNE